MFLCFLYLFLVFYLWFLVFMPSLGERLKKAREEAGLNIKKFSDLSKIQTKYLERLEKGEYEKLPAPVYTQGFLKKYIEILNLDGQEILAEYQKEAEAAKLKQVKFKTLPSLRSPTIIITSKTITWLMAAVIILAIGGYLFYQLDFLIAPPLLSLDYPSEDLAISRSTIEISGRSDPSAKLTINGQQVYIEEDGKFVQEINLTPGVNTLKIEAVNRFGKKSGITRQIIVK